MRAIKKPSLVRLGCVLKTIELFMWVWWEATKVVNTLPYVVFRPEQ
jgi:hypothetical protein